MSRPLTSQQQIVYDFIRDKIVTRGYGPTVREIGEHMNIKSPNGVMCHLRALEKKGMIVRKANKSRAIELTEDITRGLRVKLPVSGVVKKSLCIMNEESSELQVDFADLLGEGGRVAIEVQDDSLQEAAICKGDTLIVQPQTSARNAQLAVIRWQDQSSSGQPRTVQLVRYLYIHDGQVRLQPTNRSIPATTVDQADIVGVVVGVVRNLMA